MPQQSSGFDINGPTHVHGYHDSRMVMGVNDVSQIDNEEVRKLTYTTDALVKPNNNHVYGVSHTDRCISLIQNAQLICILVCLLVIQTKFGGRRLYKNLGIGQTC